MLRSGFCPEDVKVKHPDMLWIGGEWRKPHSGRLIELISPNSEQVIGAVAEADEADMDAAVAAARDAFDNGPWPRMTVAERNEIMKGITEILRAREPEIAAAYTAQMGALVGMANFHVPEGTVQFDHARELGANFQYVQEVETTATPNAYLVYEPVGVVAAIAPWNGPYGLMVSKLAPALISGCCVIMKPSPETPLETYIIAEACEEAGIPAGVVNLVCGHREASEHLVRNHGVDKVAFTGSTAAGKRIGVICAERVARCTLELGGKSAAIVCDDFPTEAVAGMMSFLMTLLSGQICAMLTRLIVPRHRQQEIAQAIAAEMAKIRIGPSDDPETQLGPIAMKRQLERIEAYIEEGRKTATLLFGGSRPKHLNKGYFIEPTLFADVDNRSRIAQEEIFGPVLCIIPADDIDDAVRIANESDYGLHGSVLTHDPQVAFDIARRIRTGAVGQNGLKVDWDLPMGGMKQSGIGREGGLEGQMAYLETKTLYLSGPVKVG